MFAFGHNKVLKQHLSAGQCKDCDRNIILISKLATSIYNGYEKQRLVELAKHTTCYGFGIKTRIDSHNSLKCKELL